MRAQKIYFSSHFELFMTLVALSIGMWWLFDRTKSGLVFSLILTFILASLTQFFFKFKITRYICIVSIIMCSCFNISCHCVESLYNNVLIKWLKVKEDMCSLLNSFYSCINCTGYLLQCHVSLTKIPLMTYTTLTINEFLISTVHIAAYTVLCDWWLDMIVTS